MSGYKSDEFSTLSGRRVHVLDPKPEDVALGDIANALSRICRFGGQVYAHVSVAQHSVMVAEIVADLGGSKQEQLIGLLHDATEAYVGDVISPLKRQLPGFQEIERKWALAIGQAFNLGDALANESALVKQADEVAFYTEWRDMFPDRPPVAGANPSKTRSFHPAGPDEARALFLAKYDELTR